MFQNKETFAKMTQHLNVYYDTEKHLEPFCLEFLRTRFSENPNDIPKECLAALETLRLELNSPHIGQKDE